MAHATYTDSQIIAAGEKLRAEGKDPNPNAIRVALGGGNVTRIKKVWLDHEGSDPQESLLKKTADPGEERFAIEISWPVQDAASKVEGVFEKLLADISERAERKIEKLLDREEERHRNAEAELQGELKVSERLVEQKEKERYEIFEELLAAKRKIESLEASIESMGRQIDQFKEKQPS